MKKKRRSRVCIEQHFRERRLGIVIGIAEPYGRKMKIVDGEGDENDDDDNDEFHDCREKFKTNILKTVIKKLSPSKNRRTCSQIAALNGD